jgi:geranylgeranyl pyrophosphate synthase
MPVREDRPSASRQPAGPRPARPQPARPAPEWGLRPGVAARLRAAMRDAIAATGGPGSGPVLAGLRDGGSATTGQQLRPAVVLAFAAIGGRTIDDRGVLPAAAAVELLDRGMLDGAPAGRGDLLVAAATGLASQVSPQAGVLIAETLAHLYSGRALQDQLRYDACAPTHRLMEVVRLTTGSLFRAACLLGAQTFDSGPVLRAVAGGFGMDLGICVQLLDDLLDVVSSPSPAGPPTGNFAAGRLTLPIALAIRDCPELAGLLRPGPGQVSRERAAGLLHDASAALAATAATARTYANGAEMRLGPVATGHQVTRWPTAYLASRLKAGTGERHRWLATPLAGAI